MTSSPLVIFDCDGVLVDSEWLACEVESELLAERGIDLSAAEIGRRFIGTTVPEMLATIETEAGVALGDDFAATHMNALTRAFAERLRPIAGVADVLSGLDCARAVASNSALARVRTSLAITGLDAHFDACRVFSSELVARPKPAPDLYRHIVAQLEADPTATLVIEDSATGVAAARAAGLTVIGFIGASHCNPKDPARLRDAGAADIVSHMDDLPARLTRFFA